MIWLFERGPDDLRIQSLYDNIAGEYVLTLWHPDGNHSVERYPNTSILEARLAALEEALKTEEWHQPPRAPRLKDSWHL